MADMYVLEPVGKAQRMRVPGGWIYRVPTTNGDNRPVFVPEPPADRLDALEQRAPAPQPKCTHCDDTGVLETDTGGNFHQGPCPSCSKPSTPQPQPATGDVQQRAAEVILETMEAASPRALTAAEIAQALADAGLLAPAWRFDVENAPRDRPILVCGHTDEIGATKFFGRHPGRWARAWMPLPPAPVRP